MQVQLQIPVTLRPHCGDHSTLHLLATSLAELLRIVEMGYPRLHQSICDDARRIRPHINLFLNNAVLPKPILLETQLSEGDVLTIMPAVSGG